MDECDASDLRMEQEETIRMKNHRAMMVNKNVSVDCEECGDLIPQARQKATGGTDLCIECATDAEMRFKHVRR